MSPSTHGLEKRGSKKKNASYDWDTPPPGLPPVRRNEEEDDGPYERGRAYWRPKPDLGQGRASVKLGPVEFKAGGKGVSATFAMGIVGSVAMTGVSAYVALPAAAVVLLGLAPMLFAVVLILTVLRIR